MTQFDLNLSHFSPTKSSRFLSSLSPDEQPKDGAASRSPKKGVSPKNRDGMSEKRQTLDKNIKQLFGARMASKGIQNDKSIIRMDEFQKRS